MLFFHPPLSKKKILKPKEQKKVLMQLGKIWTNFYLNIHPSCKSNCHKFLRSPSRMQRAPESMTRLLTFRCMCIHCNALHVCHQATPHVAGCDSPNLNAPHCTPSLPFYLFIPASLEVCSFDSCILCIVIFSADSVDETGKRTCPAANKKYGSPPGISEAVS